MRKGQRKEEKKQTTEKKPQTLLGIPNTTRDSHYIHPGFHSRNLVWTYSKKQQRKLLQELLFALLNLGILIFEHPIISCSPDTPCHKDDDFHGEGDREIVFDCLENLEGWPCGDDRNSN
jgi:hypothetical protein